MNRKYPQQPLLSQTTTTTTDDAKARYLAQLYDDIMDATRRRDASPDDRERFFRLYYIELLFVSWMSLGFTVAFVGLTVHISLHSMPGVFLFGVSILMLLVTMTELCAWAAYGEEELRQMVVFRHVIAAIKGALLVGSIGLMIWALVVMVQNTIDGGS